MRQKILERPEYNVQIEWYTVESEAEERGKKALEFKDEYHGGVWDGMLCGREKQMDEKDLFAVSIKLGRDL